MVLIAIGAFTWSATELADQGYPGGEIALSSLDLVTIAVPPALPLILTIGIGFAVSRLTKKQIFCTSPPRVNYAGKINMMCFDKTGTITEDDLALQEVQPMVSDGFGKGITETADLSGPLLDVMVTCHSVSKVKGTLLGHPVDVRMFESTKWDMKDPTTDTSKHTLQVMSNPGNSRQIEILRRFEFEPALQRMSVIIKNSDGKIYLCSKGSPEAIRSLSVSVPGTFDKVLREKAAEGIYVLGCGFRELAIKMEVVNELKRTEVENNLTFAGLLSFENKLKSDSVDTINQLLGADISVIMITGDNVHTAIAVGRKCGILDPEKPVAIGDMDEDSNIVWTDVDNPSKTYHAKDILPDPHFEIAATGKALKRFFTEKNFEVIDRAKIFARTTPDQKAEICERFVDRGFFVGMCGDGTNDCGALKTAHIGLALSEAEASVVAPFTSKKKVISDVVKVISEGRCALHTSFVAFKYMILYPIIQLISALRLYEASSVLGDFQYLYTDIVLVLPLAVFMCWTHPNEKLSKRTPPSSLFHPKIVISIIVEVILNIGGIVLINVILVGRSWYKPIIDIYPELGDKLEDTVVCLENFTTYLWANFPYIITAISFNNNTPFRKPFYTNIPFTITVIATFLLSWFLLVIPDCYKISILQIYPYSLDDTELWNPPLEFPAIPNVWRWEMFGLAVLCLVLCVVFESFILEGPVADWVNARWEAKEKSKKAYTPVATGSKTSQK